MQLALINYTFIFIKLILGMIFIMYLNNIKITNPLLWKKTIEFIEWKHNCGSNYVDENILCKYFHISTYEANNLINALIKYGYIYKEMKTYCPFCLESYELQLTSDFENIECTCENSFKPTEIIYHYRINEKTLILENEEDDRISNFKENGNMSEQSKKISVFMSYSHTDEEYLKEINKHLSVLKRSSKIDTWSDKEILGGSDLDEEIKKHLENDDIILLLISSDFLASDYCYDTEMKTAIARHEKQDCKVIPIIVRECDWYEAPFGRLKAWPKDGKPIKSFEDRDEAYTQIAKNLKSIIANL